MPTKKDRVLSKSSNAAGGEYPLNPQETLELASLIALVKQAQQAQDVLYSSIVNRAAERYSLTGKTLNINMEEVMEKGAKYARLVVAD